MAVAPVQAVAIKIDENTQARIRRLADARQRTPHWLMREAITQYVDRVEKRQAFRQDALQAWEAFRATGQHVAADHADAWLAQLARVRQLIPVFATFAPAPLYKSITCVSFGVVFQNLL